MLVFCAFIQAVLKDPFLNKAFGIVALTMFLVIMVMMGAEIELRVIWTKFKRPVGIIIGFISQYLFMPAVSNHKLNFIVYECSLALTNGVYALSTRMLFCLNMSRR